MLQNIHRKWWVFRPVVKIFRRGVTCLSGAYVNPPAHETSLLLSGWDCMVWQGVAKLVPLRKLLPTPSISVVKGVKHKVKHKVKQSNESKERGGGSLFMVAKSSEQPGVHVDKDLDSILLEASSTLQSYLYSTTQSSLNSLSALLCLIYQSVMGSYQLIRQQLTLLHSCRSIVRLVWVGPSWIRIIHNAYCFALLFL